MGEPPRMSGFVDPTAAAASYGDLGHGGEQRRYGEEKETARNSPPGAGYKRPLRGHRTLLKWHRTRPVTTGLMRREVCKTATHRTMATGRWL